MNKFLVVLLASMMNSQAFAGDLSSCQVTAEKFAQAVRDTYENPADLQLSKAYEVPDEGQLAYKYAFDYIVPYNDQGRGTVISSLIEIRLYERSCELRKLEVVTQ